MPSVNKFNAYQTTHGRAAANQLLFSWLANEENRGQLLASMAASMEPLFFTSHASKRDDTASSLTSEAFTDYDWIDGPRDYEQKAVLLAHPHHVKQVLEDQNVHFSNSPYRGLGGYFMLALDDDLKHDQQRKYALDLLQLISTHEYDALATLAFKAGALVPLKNHEFDLAAMAENIAARYVLMIYGFAQKDLALILECTRRIGKGLQHQILGRHFVFEPANMVESRAALGRLAQRATEIIGLIAGDRSLHTRLQEEDLEEIDTDLQRIQEYEFRQADGTDRSVLERFVPILKRMALKELVKPDFTPSEKGLIAASLIGGSVTNIQNSICIAVAEIFKTNNPNFLHLVRQQAIHERTANPDAMWDPDNSKITDLIKEALRVCPPVVFIPRRVKKEVVLCGGSRLTEGTLVLVALAGQSHHAPGAPAPLMPNSQFRYEEWIRRTTKPIPKESPLINATDSESNPSCPFSMIMGGAPLAKLPTKVNSWQYKHSCPGMMMSMNVISYTVRQLFVLPSLAQRMNTDTGKAYGLEKRWGFQCTWYPLSFQRHKLLKQTPLQTELPIKAPVDVHSQALRQVLALGAPFIDKVLADSKMVHFASFMFIDNDSKLTLFTMYDGDFDAYIGHFAREFGHLFDRFFSHVAVQPKMPIRENPFEFVQYLKQFVRPPVEGYYFSAYPEAQTEDISNAFTRQFDFDQIRGV